MFQLKNETPSPKRIGKRVKARNRTRLGPRKKSAQRPSRLARRRAAGRARTAVVSARVWSPERHPERRLVPVIPRSGATSDLDRGAHRRLRRPVAGTTVEIPRSARNGIPAGCYFFCDCK
jgi:hypothetical protein